MNMPIMNGWQFAKELRDGQMWRVPVVVLTARTMRSAAHRDRRGRVPGQTFDMSSLYSVVDHHLSAPAIARQPAGH